MNSSAAAAAAVPIQISDTDLRSRTGLTRRDLLDRVHRVGGRLPHLADLFANRVIDVLQHGRSIPSKCLPVP